MASYELMAKQIASLAELDRGLIPVLSNASAVLYDGMERINWAGFYLMDQGSLVVGPFQGKPACVRIEIGKGVCGTAVQTGRVQLVEDVHKFPGHIACDSASRSEIVLPLRDRGRIIGVLDIDSPELGRFTQVDKAGLEAVVKVLEEVTDFPRID